MLIGGYNIIVTIATKGMSIKINFTLKVC